MSSTLCDAQVLPQHWGADMEGGSGKPSEEQAGLPPPPPIVALQAELGGRAREQAGRR